MSNWYRCTIGWVELHADDYFVRLEPGEDPDMLTIDDITERAAFHRQGDMDNSQSTLIDDPVLVATTDAGLQALENPAAHGYVAVD